MNKPPECLVQCEMKKCMILVFFRYYQPLQNLKIADTFCCVQKRERERSTANDTEYVDAPERTGGEQKIVDPYRM